ncbi:MAG: Holliday junction branch migration protein RuvA [Minisyncoccota bacterium]
MLHYLIGKLIQKKENFFILETGGFGLRIFCSLNTLKKLPACAGGPAINEEVKVFTHMNIKEDAWDIYGFFDQNELDFFTKLISVNGVGPKTALNILNVDTAERLMAAINEGRVDLLTKASGIGKKTSERVVVELKGKFAQINSEGLTGLMESDSDIVDVLCNLGYTKEQSKKAISKVDPKVKSIEDRIKAALNILKNG